MVTIKHIFLFFLVFILIIWFFENMNVVYSNSEAFEEEVKQNENMPEHIVESPVVPKLKTIPTTNCCPLKENDLKSKYYITRFLMGDGAQICPKPVKSAKEFNKDFFNFRDSFTNENSSDRLDSVDKIINLNLQGYLGEAREFPGMKISDVYDELTCPETKLYDKKCVRIPYFDNTMHKGYDYSFVKGMHNTRDNWQYSNEKSINGGPLEKNFYAHDPSEPSEFPYLG